MIGVGKIGIAASRGGAGTPPNPDFVFTVNTANAGSASDTIVLPLLSGGTYSGTIDWGDSSSSVLSYANRSHTYSSGGAYTITISGTIEGWAFNNTGDKAKLTRINNFGNLTITDKWSFYGCSNMTITATDAPIVSATDLRETFRAATSINDYSFDNWDFTGVDSLLGFLRDSNFRGSFNNTTTGDVRLWNNFLYGCSNFNSTMNNCDMSSAEQSSLMLYNCDAYDQSMSDWDITLLNPTNFMLAATGLSPSNYDATLIGWEATLQAAYPGGVGYPITANANFGGSQFTSGGAGETAKNSLVSNFGWTITDGGGV